MHKVTKLDPEASSKINNTLNTLAKKGIKYSLLGDYKYLPHRYEGYDIDLVVDDTGLCISTLVENDWLIQKRGRFTYRAFHYISEYGDWLVLDVLSASKNKILHYIVENPINRQSEAITLKQCNHVGDVSYMIYKYLFLCKVRGEYQLEKLENKLGCCSEIEKLQVKELINTEVGEKATNEIYNKYFDDSNNLKDNLNTIINDVKNRRGKIKSFRYVYNGNLIFRNLIKKPSIIYKMVKSLIFKDQFLLPTISFVGNDGAGKTSLCVKLKKSTLYKTDPLHINMKRKSPKLPIYKKCRPLLKSTRSRMDNNSIISWILGWVLEFGDFIDRYARYLIGRMWADSGLGIVFFERYATDRLRGEYRKGKNSLYPLEQFFPMPTAFILLDVSPTESLKRKPDDGHTLKEQKEKRINYLNLVKTIKPSKIINSDSEPIRVYKTVNEYIWNVSISLQTKNNSLQRNRAIWDKKSFLSLYEYQKLS